MYTLQSDVNPTVQPTQPADLYNKPLIPTWGASAIKEEIGKDPGYNSQSRPCDNQGEYRLRTMVYQGYTDNCQEHQDQDNETGPTNTTKTLHADQDLQFLTDHEGYKEYEQFAGFVGIKTICRNCEQLFLSKNKLHRHLKTKCS